MKTIRQHLKDLPEPHKTLALQNINLHTPLGLRVLSPTRALHDAFNWAKSNEGFGFWMDFAECRLRSRGQQTIC